MEQPIIRDELLSRSDLSHEEYAEPRTRFRIAPTAELALINSTAAQAAQELSLVVKNANGASAPIQVAFLNMRNYVSATHDKTAIGAFMDMDRVYPDGIALQIARCIIHRGRFRRVSGTDTVPLLLAKLPPTSRVYLLGGTPALSAQLEQRFLRAFPHLELTGCHHGFFPSSLMQDASVGDLRVKSSATMLQGA